MRPMHLSLLFLTPLVVSSGLACDPGVDDENFREDVILCEDALSHVLACCPGLAPPQTACEYYFSSSTSSCGCSGTSGNSTSTTRRTPVLSLTRSAALADGSCADISANDGCAALGAELAQENLEAWSTDCNGSTTGVSL